MSDRRNGVEVRGLRVLKTTEGSGRISRWSLIGALFGNLPSEVLCSVLTVYDGPGDPVATRRFTREADAERARERFVVAVKGMDPGACAGADWQKLLDDV